MWTRPYGQTGEQVSIIGFGGMRFDNLADIEGNAEIVHYAYEKGINYFDTAPGYGNGKSESIMGAAFKQMDREKIFVSTKSNAATPGALRKDLEASLKRMGVEVIDFFHIWWVTTLEAWRQRVDGGAVAEAVKAKEEGLIKHLAISSHLPGVELGEVLTEGPLEGVLLGYCAINFPYRQAAVELAGRQGLGVVTMNPLGGGLIPQNAERFDFIRTPADDTVVAAALRFNVSNPNVTCALVGVTTRDHVDQAVAAVENFQPYSAEHIASIRENILEAFDGLCTGCGYCLPCPEGIDIPKMMDAYNLMALKDAEAAKDRLKCHWALSPAEASVCSRCGVCEERCTQHLPIRDRMKEIAELADE